MINYYYVKIIQISHYSGNWYERCIILQYVWLKFTEMLTRFNGYCYAVSLRIHWIYLNELLFAELHLKCLSCANVEKTKLFNING